MPKLDLKSSHEYWQQYGDDTIYKVIAFMETVEDWTVDGDPELEENLNKLGAALDKIESFTLGKEDLIVKLCSHLKTSRILRILQAIDTVKGGAAARIISYAQTMFDRKNNPICNLFLQRNVAFERMRLLSRVFSSERLALLEQILE